MSRARASNNRSSEGEHTVAKGPAATSTKGDATKSGEQQAASTSVQRNESDGASGRGEQTSKQKRALDQNVKGKQAHQSADTPAGQHATGSFTEEPKKTPGR